MRKRPAGTVPCGSFGGPLTKSVHVITEIGNPSRDETLERRVDLVPVGFGRKSLGALPDELPVNVSGLHRFQRPAAARREGRGPAREEEG